MSWAKKIFAGLGLTLAAIVVIGYGSYVYMNQPSELQEPNYYSYYKSQDKTPEGKVGIFISIMMMPEGVDEEFYTTVFEKPMKIIPWPFREILKWDDGMPLFDTVKYFEFDAFEPTNLMDYKGSTTDIDGVPYVEKWRQGKIDFVPGQGYTPGYFIYPERPAGMSTKAAELVAKARVYYHAENAGLKDGRVPHEAGLRAFINGAMNKVQEKYGDIPWVLVNSDKFGEARQGMRDLLDTGVDTVVFAPPRVIYSHYEEFNASVKHGMEYIREWEEENGKSIKVIIAPQLGDFQPTRQAYLNMLRERLDTLPQGASLKVVVSVHGMPWEMVEHEAWLELAPRYRDKILAEAEQILESEYEFKDTKVILSQDHFAEMTKMLPSTNEIYWQAIDAGYDYVINMPIEFQAENTDTLYAHAVVNFKGFDDYDVYDTIEHDWSKPLVRTFKQGDTTIIYNGLPMGSYNTLIVEGHFQQMDYILSKWDRNRAMQRSPNADLPTAQRSNPSSMTAQQVSDSR